MAISGSSILNDVMGPVMRGPSSSHTAGPFFIGKVVRHLLGRPVARARMIFAPEGSFAHVYTEQGSDVGFVAGLLGMSITDERFRDSLRIAKEEGLEVLFEVSPLVGWTHPNAVQITVVADNERSMTVVAESIGGGQIQVVQIEQTSLRFRCQRPALLLVGREESAMRTVAQQAQVLNQTVALEWNLNPHDSSKLSALASGSQQALDALANLVSVRDHCIVWSLPAVGLIAYNESKVSFLDVADILRITRERAWTLAELGLNYESQLLQRETEEAEGEMVRRWGVMRDAIERGLSRRTKGMRFLTSTARDVREANRMGRLVCGGLLAEASAGALAVMEQNSSGGVICAAPTAGSAGIIPGLLGAIQQQRGLSDPEIAGALYAAGVIGVLISTRATFAAETCACAAETGAAAAMAAAAIVHLHRGTIEQALDAATMCLMNTIGLACDPVQGAVEIPCHARNLAGVAHALVAADSVLGGFRAVLPLDQTIDAMLAVGRSLPSSIRCTSRGGLAATPAARSLVRLAVVQ